MASLLISPPALEPLTLDDAKLFLRVDGIAEDSLIAALIAAARQHAEAVTGRALITQGWRIVLDAWPKRRIVRLTRAPVQTVDAVTLRAADGTPSLVDPALYGLDRATQPPRLVVSERAGAPGSAVNGIEIDFTAGYGAPSDVPPALLLAVRRLAAHWYEHRDTRDVPAPVAGLLAPYRMVSLGARP